MRYKIGKDDFKYVNSYGVQISEQDFSKISCMTPAEVEKLIKMQAEAEKALKNAQVHV